MTIVYASIIAGVVGLAFGSFLNVCVTRWPNDESIVGPRSHCPNCERTLAWWENIPVMSWLALRGRCRSCHEWIGLRYPLVELAVGGLWALAMWQTLNLSPYRTFGTISYIDLMNCGGLMIFIWLLVGLAALDAENLWLPNRLIWPGLFLGFALSVARPTLEVYYYEGGSFDEWQHQTAIALSYWFLGLVIAGGVVGAIRFIYKQFSENEGVGLGDVKLTAMLGGWLDSKSALLALALGVLIAAVYALILLRTPKARKGGENWGKTKLPFGTFIAMGGIISGFCGTWIVSNYLHWAGF